MEPVAEQLSLPASYGHPGRLVPWAWARARLEQARHYWLATTRADGRPHVVPVDGLWHDDACLIGGDAATVHMRNLARDPRAVVHLEDAQSAVIVEGAAQQWTPSPDEAARLVEASRDKYGYAPPVSAYLAGVWCVRAHIVLAWSALPEDATRFRFG